MDRRNFVLGISANALFLSTCRSLRHAKSQTLAIASPLNLRVRKSWEPGQEADYKKQFIEVVRWLRSQDSEPNASLSWSRFVNIHDNSCYHGNWYIIPWHRLFVNYFETACQIALQDPQFALPYWDWTRNPTIPSEFFLDPNLTVERQVIEGDAIPMDFTGQPILDGILADRDFYNFHSRPEDYRSKFHGPAGSPGSTSGQFEAGPHNSVHNYIGGAMSTNRSPNDPIFWLHHSNVDRIWMQWRQKNPTSLPTIINGGIIASSVIASTPDVANHWLQNELQLRYGDNELQDDLPSYDGSRVARAGAQVKDLLDHKALGYTYDDYQEIPFVSRVQATGVKRSVVAAEIQGKKSTERGVLTATLAMNPTVLEQFRSQAGNRVSLAAINMQAPADAEVRRTTVVRFFATVDGKALDLEAATKDSAYKMPEYLGFFAFFATEHHGNHPVDAQFDVTSHLRSRLSAQTRRVTLYAVPAHVRNQTLVPVFAGANESELFLQFELLPV